ncbi:unnamed protein product [Candidula unifasciata]|uniref:G-protein coupled receptors family 1 profile domain-containing protein n=1 Tax=Candidula unifasciata TaxID=100452 RepID=A0A8S3ZZY3_9EUPU|nr:unnamed protein product [Candidula unifasciata]
MAVKLVALTDTGPAVNISNWGFPIRDSQTTQRRGNNYVDADPVADLVHWTVVFVLTPTISIIGVIGNSFSIIVLSKHGFKKSSNILLFSLAISDIMFMIGINGPSKPMYEWGGEGFDYPEETARILYYVYQITDSLNWIFCPTSFSIPILIMAERLIAVFFPLRFHSLVTVRRTVVAILAPLVLSTIAHIYIRTWFKFSYVFDSARNVSVGIVGRTDAYWAQRQVSEIFKICDNAMFVFVLFVGAGCVAIGVKMKMVAKKRQQMTNNFMWQKAGKTEAESSRTTKMLLCLCIVYSFACFPVGFPAVIPGFMVFPVFEDEPRHRSIGVFIFHVYKMVFCVNASCNFYLYVAINKKFRDTFRSLICR